LAAEEAMAAAAIPKLRAAVTLWARDAQRSRLGGTWGSRGVAATSQVPALPPPEAVPCRRVVVTGLGLVTPLGATTAETWEGICSARSGVRPLAAEDLLPPADVFSLDQGLRDAIEGHSGVNLLRVLPSKTVASVPRMQVDRNSAEDVDLLGLPGYYRRGVLKRLTGEFDDGAKKYAAFVGYALSAAEQALGDAGWRPAEIGDAACLATATVIGSGIGSVQDIAGGGMLVWGGGFRKLAPHFVPKVLLNTPAGRVSMAFDLRGPNHSMSTACATGAHAVGDAFRMVQRGDCDVAVAGGTEASIDALSLSGFCRLKALSKRDPRDAARASRPFDADRDGFVMGEGAGMLVLEELEHAKRRGARIYAEVRGYGLSGDASHAVQPDPEGRGAERAMRMAIAQSGLEPSAYGYVNAHATSTPLGDAVEARTIARVFSSEASPREAAASTLVSSTKGAMGHLLGAAGAVEVALTVLALHHNAVPRTLNLDAPCGEVKAVLPLHGGEGGGEAAAARALVVGAAPCGGPDGEMGILRPESRLRAALCNSFGFGGTNACIALSVPPE